MEARSFARVLGRLLVAGLVAGSFPSTARSHGGTFPPPPPPPPAGGTYGGPGDVTPSGPTTPGAGGPSTPGPGTPSSPAPSPGGPSAPSTPSTGGGAPGAPGGAPPAGPSTLDATSIDWTSWELWWNYNRHRWLDVRTRLERSLVTTGSDEYYLGLGTREAARDRLAASEQRLAEELVPLLVTTLKGDGSPDVLSSSLIALAKSRRACKLAGVAPELEIARLLSNANVEVSETAAIALGMLGSDANLALLERLLADDVEALRSIHEVAFDAHVPERTRAFAAYGLAVASRDLGDYFQLVIARRLRDTLELELGRRGSAEVAAACVQGLGLVRLPDDAADVASQAERPPMLVSRQQALRYLLALLDAPQASRSVLAQVPTSVARVAESMPAGAPARRAAVARLVSLATERATDTEMRRGAVLALAIGGGDAELDALVQETLIAASRDAGDLQTRCFALVALGEASGLGATPERDRAREALLAALSKGSLEMRSWAALGLGLQQRLRRDRGAPDSGDAGAALRVELDAAENPSLVGALSIALGISGDGDASEGLRRALAEHSDPRARGHVCIALGMLDARVAADEILEVAKAARFQPELLAFSSVALGLLGDRQAVAALVELLDRSTSLASQAGLASGLGKLGDARAIEPLLALAGDPARPALVRAFALVALGGIADDRKLPWNEPLSRGVNYRAARPTLASPTDSRGVLDIL